LAIVGDEAAQRLKSFVLNTRLPVLPRIAMNSPFCWAT
jgi:hypothetical protein